VRANSRHSGNCSATSPAHPAIASQPGTPEQIAALIEDWFRDGAGDGFNLMPPVLPAMLELFIAEVVPILQRRGLFRTAYTGDTLRAHYRLPRPDIRFG
jgi:hypothetical protein